MNINWKVRLVNKNFWLSLIPAILLLVQAVGAPRGITLDFGELGNQLLAIVNAVFAVLAGLVLMGEQLTAWEWCGCAVMFAAVILAQLPSPKKGE